MQLNPRGLLIYTYTTYLHNVHCEWLRSRSKAARVIIITQHNKQYIDQDYIGKIGNFNPLCMRAFILALRRITTEKGAIVERDNNRILSLSLSINLDSLTDSVSPDLCDVTGIPIRDVLASPALRYIRAMPTRGRWNASISAYKPVHRAPTVFGVLRPRRWRHQTTTDIVSLLINVVPSSTIRCARNLATATRTCQALPRRRHDADDEQARVSTHAHSGVRITSSLLNMSTNHAGREACKLANVAHLVKGVSVFQPERRAEKVVTPWNTRSPLRNSTVCSQHSHQPWHLLQINKMTCEKLKYDTITRRGEYE